MTTLALPNFDLSERAATAPKVRPKDDWPLMGDVASLRAGVPEALILWRKARGEARPAPMIWTPSEQ